MSISDPTTLRGTRRDQAGVVHEAAQHVAWFAEAHHVPVPDLGADVPTVHRGLMHQRVQPIDQVRITGLVEQDPPP